MQLSPYSTLPLVIIVHALFMQGVWLFLGRRARDIYLGDIMHFRKPSSVLSRYYDWRVTKFLNALIEGIVFLVILLASLILISIILVDFAAFIDAILYVLFVMFLSFLSSIQMAWRVKEINQRENELRSSISSSTDKIGVAREMIENLIVQGPMGDGRIWFALYRLAQKPNQVGWAIRDVLFEKAKELRAMDQYSTREYNSATRDKGPGIES
ncbi:MAG: hypothetical protein AM326_08955 [Candidatus Thorarchaeota archaeon SMTZ-45]|nr:MAG: hypothetical protein AM325_07745 [Candidatus Thorarchaeota archaeon SMTZ1-45]KXH75524.1 MAG: hypothetical protein AM326_08955 [Candidatus Thorarchaeota archaeon SMTZ-45]